MLLRISSASLSDSSLFVSRDLSLQCLVAGACKCGRHGIFPGEPAATGARQNRQGHGPALPAPQHGLPPRLLLRRPASGARPFFSSQVLYVRKEKKRSSHVGLSFCLTISQISSFDTRIMAVQNRDSIVDRKHIPDSGQSDSGAAMNRMAGRPDYVVTVTFETHIGLHLMYSGAVNWQLLCFRFLK